MAAETKSLQRRCKPELLESTTSSSSTSTSSKKPRRFALEPVETSSRSSHKQCDDPDSSSSAGSAATEDQTPSTETPKARRKFMPEPLETTTRHSSERPQAESTEDDEDFAAPLLPHERMCPSDDSSKRPARRKFSPQLIETAKRSRKHGDKFPALLPSDKTNVTPGDLPSLRIVPTRPDPTPLPPTNTPTTSALEIPTLRQLPQRQGSMRPHYNTRQNTRQHSYRVPDLPSIDSSESGDSEAPSLEPPHDTEDSDTSDEAYKDATRMRESVDERFSGYLLALAAKQAEKQLREQEAAAFINTDYHQPVAHYMNRSDSDESISGPVINKKGQRDRTRRDSGDEKAALKEMQKHGEKVFKLHQNRKKTGAFNVEFDTQPFKQDIWQNAGGQFSAPRSAHRNTPPRELIGGKQQDPGLRQMRKAASPPMLGGDIDFPRCPSPDHARFDVTQGADYLRKNVCYLGEQAQEICNGKLWGATSIEKKEKSGGKGGPGIWGGGKQQQQTRAKAPQQAPKSPGGGLWGGFCNKIDNEAATPQGPTGLITPISTPRTEKDDPFASMFKAASLPSNRNSYTNLSSMGNAPTGPRPSSPLHRGQAPPSPPPSIVSPNNHLMAPSSELDARLFLESRISTEFSDAFVTQVFNYLSLGYPSLARKFDDELARISKYPVTELREDDKLAEVRGYVRLGNEEVDGIRGVDESMCKRWRALRLYVREWGRQMLQKEVEGGIWGDDPARAWGLPGGRRGSWGN